MPPNVSTCAFGSAGETSGRHIWILPLRNLMCAVHRRQTGANVQKLEDISVSYQIVDSPGEKLPVCLGLGDDAREGLDKLVAGLPVDRIVVFTPQPVIPDAG